MAKPVRLNVIYNAKQIRTDRQALAFADDVRRRLDKRDTKQASRPWFRGLSSLTYRLVPTVGRVQKYAGRDRTLDRELERQLLHRFRRGACAHLGHVLGEWDAILLARHHGLPTRLLDWSESPLVALYFACCDEPKNDGAIWSVTRGVHVHENDILDVPKLHAASSRSPLGLFTGKQPSIKLVYPFNNSARVIAQSGIFTIQSEPTQALEIYANLRFDATRIDIDEIEKVTVPKSAKPRILRELDTLAVNGRTLFPDLDGLANGLWQRETLWRGK